MNARYRPMLAVLISLLLVGCVGGCAGPTTDTDPTPIDSPSPAMSPAPSVIPSVPPSPAPLVGLGWERVDDPDLASRPYWGSLGGVIAGGPGAIAWGERFCAPGEADDAATRTATHCGPEIWTTGDGRDWTPTRVEEPADAHPEFPSAVLDVTAGGPGYVAVGAYLPTDGPRTSLVWTSTDGSSWSLAPDRTPFEGAAVDQVLAWRGGLLAFGCALAGPTDCVSSLVWASSDGESWERIVPSLPAGVVSLGIVDPGPDRLWSSGWPEPAYFLWKDTPQPPRLSSIDGRTWTVEPLPVLGLERFHPLASGTYLTAAGFAVGDDVEPGPAWLTREPGLYRSTDGVTWEPLVIGRELGDEIIAVGDTLIMVGMAGDACWDADAVCPAGAWRSTDGGLTWEQVPISGTSPADVTRAAMVSIAALPDGTLVAVGRELAGMEPVTAAWVSRARPDQLVGAGSSRSR